MATIRARLTAWNSLVLVFILLVFAVAAYVFLQQVTVAQVDRSLRQQVRASLLAAQEAQERGKNDSAALRILDRELGEVGLDVVKPALIPNAVVTIPERINAKGERRGSGTGEAAALIDWADLRKKISAPHRGDQPFTVAGTHGGSRISTQAVSLGSRQILLVSSQPLGEVSELLETARVAALVALPIALLLSLFSGYALARRALMPVASMTAEAQRIGARNLHDRLSIQNPTDELGQLAVTFNNVLERVDRALEQQRRFTADASHELRTPIALIRAEADVALSGNGRGGNEEEEYRAALSVIRDGSQQLSRVVNDLFLLARADAGQTMITPHEMQLDDLVRATSHGMRALADEKGLELKINVNGSVPYQGDEEMLRRILRNLLDNAIKYSTGPGTIEVSLIRDGRTYRVCVADTGQGISPEAQRHIFDRFFRGDAARGHLESASGSGAGLGLAIAREIAELHGGRVELSRSNGKGSTFELILPAHS